MNLPWERKSALLCWERPHYARSLQLGAGVVVGLHLWTRKAAGMGMRVVVENWGVASFAENGWAWGRRRWQQRVEHMRQSEETVRWKWVDLKRNEFLWNVEFLSDG